MCYQAAIYPKKVLLVTTSEKENGFLLIEVFRKTKLWPPGVNPWWPFLCTATGQKKPCSQEGEGTGQVLCAFKGGESKGSRVV
jgi:hypothetical protein